MYTCSIASPLLTIDTPQFPFSNCKPSYGNPMGVITEVGE
jgi:hypothetical protein